MSAVKKGDTRMGFLADLAASIDSMMHSLNESPNFLVVLILVVALYVVAFLLASAPSALLALTNLTARRLHPRKDTWLSPDQFDTVLNTLFVLLIVPVAIGTLKAIVAGHIVAALVIGLDLAAAIYHGVFVGRTIAIGRGHACPELQAWHPMRVRPMGAPPLVNSRPPIMGWDGVVAMGCSGVLRLNGQGRPSHGSELELALTKALVPMAEDMPAQSCRHGTQTTLPDGYARGLEGG
jgi:uncharacterized membrane protein YhaH (DUF805 family)